MNLRPSEERAVMQLPDLVEMWGRSVESDGDLRPKTRAVYESWLRAFSRDVAPMPLANLTPTRCRAWIDAKKRDSPHSARAAWYALKRFLTYANENGWLPFDAAAAKPKLPRKKSNPREPVPAAHVERILAACERLAVTPHRRALHKAVLSLLVYTGLRVNEITALAVADMNWKSGALIVQDGKGGKRREVYPAEYVRDAIRDWLDYRPADCAGSAQERLFVFNRTLRLTENGIRRMIDRLCVTAGIEEHYTPHQFRASYASELLQNNAPPLAVMESLGHSDLRTTTGYAHSTQDLQRKLSQYETRRAAEGSYPVPPPPKAEKTPDPALNRGRRRQDLRRG